MSQIVRIDINICVGHRELILSYLSMKTIITQWVLGVCDYFDTIARPGVREKNVSTRYPYCSC